MSVTLRAEFKSALDEAQKIRAAAERSEEEILRFKQLTDEVLPGLDAGINPFVRVKVTGAVDSVTAMLSHASWKPFEQPDMEFRETKGTI